LQIYRLDRDGQRGGAVFIGIKGNIPSTLKRTDHTREIMCVAIDHKPWKIFVIGAFRPQSTSSSQFIESLEAHLRNLQRGDPATHSIIIGRDLNLPQVSWSPETGASSTIQTAKNDLLTDQDTIHAINVPTRAPQGLHETVPYATRTK
jgi:hypothetical protein